MLEENNIENFENIPFEETEKYGFLNGFYLSVLMLIKSPGEFYSKMHINKGLRFPVLFVLIMLSINVFFTGFYINTGLIDSPAEQLKAAMQENPDLVDPDSEIMKTEIKDPTILDLFKNLLLNFVLFYILVWVWHFSLSMAGASVNGYEATFRILAYSMVTSLVAIIPFSNPFFNILVYLWWIYLIYIGITEAHEVSKKLAVKGMLLSIFSSFILLVFVFSLAM
ncbi:MAG: YIP1 family protein [Candidatus Delongbacteria bacterium]|nr:YIP1 family protein [Candidatus Delongbacteria bacterium]